MCNSSILSLATWFRFCLVTDGKRVSWRFDEADALVGHQTLLTLSQVFCSREKIKRAISFMPFASFLWLNCLYVLNKISTIFQQKRPAWRKFTKPTGDKSTYFINLRTSNFFKYRMSLTQKVHIKFCFIRKPGTSRKAFSFYTFKFFKPLLNTIFSEQIHFSSDLRQMFPEWATKPLQITAVSVMAIWWKLVIITFRLSWHRNINKNREFHDVRKNC